ncbi:MAG: fimbrillin family protein [Clostridium sp.]|nr:fimbrillin family protein [Bacteroides sp.]MCM1197953.1 fimbrillin family protein [Clostridium sp.]
MISRHRFIPIILACAISASCEPQEEMQAENPKAYPLLVAGRIYDYGQSDADMLSKSEHIGVYMSRASEMPPKEYSNLGYKATYGMHDDYFQPDNIEAIPYFPLEGEDKWDVSAYFPYKENFDGYFPLSVADQSKVNSRTLLYARARGLDRDSRTANLRLAPALSRIVLRLHEGDGINSGQVQGATSRMNGIHTVGNFDVVACHFTAVEDSRAEVSMTAGASGDARTLAMLAIPHSDTNGYAIKIYLSGENTPRTCNVADYVPAFARGMEYVFDITVGKSCLDVTTSSAPIAGWEWDGSVDVDGEEVQ